MRLLFNFNAKSDGFRFKLESARFIVLVGKSYAVSRRCQFLIDCHADVEYVHPDSIHAYCYAEYECVTADCC